jgi:oxygen-dependent protoporphyrinogen oxidase
MLAGIYTGDPDKLSIQATMPRFLELEKKYGGVIRGLLAGAKEKKELRQASGPRYSLFLSFQDGMEAASWPGSLGAFIAPAGPCCM